MSSYTNSGSVTFTLTHAKYLASKVATDLKRIQRLYGSPSDSTIADYEAELTEFLKKGYMEEVTYGFKINGVWTEPTLRYTAQDLEGNSANDDDPGKIRPNANIVGAYFTSYMTYTWNYHFLSENEKAAFKNSLPFQRSGAPQPGVNGYLSSDKSYSSGGKSLNRSSLKS
ncbi:hypothetical protein DJ568_14855 [Mucilaginibacter hurinus]|uniref:Bacterial HORMA domain-containing protein n=1 Tax=Mucilaginibacter hurinus TaxID=2201324 RepID=A0A367GN89_9SPHI|nr:hypothetical protein [Mucilaginibacter hurinus]RCH54153.1 hypothetical protein DJ568_14855 [Mucilaginibacter hurinus]